MKKLYYLLLIYTVSGDLSLYGMLSRFYGAKRTRPIVATQSTAIPGIRPPSSSSNSPALRTFSSSTVNKAPVIKSSWLKNLFYGPNYEQRRADELYDKISTYTNGSRIIFDYKEVKNDLAKLIKFSNKNNYGAERNDSTANIINKPDDRGNTIAGKIISQTIELTFTYLHSTEWALTFPRMSESFFLSQSKTLNEIMELLRKNNGQVSYQEKTRLVELFKYRLDGMFLDNEYTFKLVINLCINMKDLGVSIDNYIDLRKINEFLRLYHSFKKSSNNRDHFSDIADKIKTEFNEAWPFVKEKSNNNNYQGNNYRANDYRDMGAISPFDKLLNFLTLPRGTNIKEMETARQQYIRKYHPDRLPGLKEQLTQSIISGKITKEEANKQMKEAKSKSANLSELNNLYDQYKKSSNQYNNRSARE